MLTFFFIPYPTPDGTGVRDYIHVVDLAKGHVCAIRKLAQNPGLVIYNLGTGHGYSVLDIIHAFEKACGKELPYVIAPVDPEILQNAGQTPAKPRKSWAGKPSTALRICAHTVGTGRAKTPTATRRYNKWQIEKTDSGTTL